MPLAATRALDLLSLLADASEPMTAAEINAAMGLGRASGYRLLETLIQQGWVRVEGEPRRYEPTLRVWDLGASFLSRNRTREVVIPYLVELALETHSPADLALHEDGECVYTDRINVLGERVLPVLFYRRPPGFASAAAKAIFAFRSEADVQRVLARGLRKMTPFTLGAEEIAAELTLTRSRGYSISDREYDANRSSVGVPIIDRSGMAVAALALAMDGPMDPLFVERVRPVILRYGHLISSQLGFRGGSQQPTG